MNWKKIVLGVAVGWTVVSIAGIVYVILSARGVKQEGAETAPQFQPFSRGATAVSRASQVDPELAALLYRYFPKPLSANFEEVFIRDYFHDRKGGFLLDVGASHHRERSTTHYLDVALGWRGIAIDALAEYAEGYARYRPRTTFIPAFISDKSDEKLDFFVNPNDPRQSTAHAGAAEKFESQKKVRALPTVTLNDLLAAHRVEKIDLLSMDIELWEPKALAGFDIDRFKPSLVVIESHGPVRDQIYKYFADHDYLEIERYTKWDGHNAYFVPAADLPAFQARPRFAESAPAP